MIEIGMSPEELEIRDSLAKFFGSKASLLDVVKRDRIKNILDLLRPQSMVRVRYIANTLLDYYETEEEATRKQILKNLNGKIGLSVDILMCKKGNAYGSKFLSLSAHFIDDNWKIRRWVLSFSVLGQNKGGGGSPGEIILKALKDWGIESKISSITMANSNRFEETLLEIAKLHIQEKELFRVYCCADIVNLMVKDAYDGISKNVEQIGNAYSFDSSILTWNNRNNQLREALLAEASGKYSCRYDVPSKNGWNKVSRVCDLVEDIYTIVFPLFEMGYPTASIFLNRLQELQSFLIEKRATAEELIKNVTEKMLERLKKYMKDMNLVLSIASVLDPRLKMEYIKFSSCKFEGNPQVSTVLETISDLYDGYAIRIPVKRKRENDSNFPRAKTNSGDDYVGMKLLREYNHLTQLPKLERKCYLEEPVVPWSDDFCPLNWWKDASPKYPTLSKLARDFIAIPMTVAISEGALEMEQGRSMMVCFRFYQSTSMPSCVFEVWF